MTFNGTPKKGEYVVSVSGFTVDSIVPATWGHELFARLVAQYGPDNVKMRDRKGNEVDFDLALKGPLDPNA